jgi:hypothetical protein
MRRVEVLRAWICRRRARLSVVVGEVHLTGLALLQIVFLISFLVAAYFWQSFEVSGALLVLGMIHLVDLLKRLTGSKKAG